MFRRLQRISSLGRLILVDGLRRHALAGLVLLTLAGETGGLFFFDFIPRDIGRVSSDFIFSVSWLAGLIFLLFHAVQVMAWDEDRRVIHTLLARPISRSEYVLGVFSGLAALLLGLNLLLGTIGYGILTVIRNSVGANYFPQLDVPSYLVAWAGLYLTELVILGVIILFSGMVRGSFTVLLMTICYFFTCNGLPVVREAVDQRTLEGIANQEGLGQLLKGLTMIFPDFSRLDYKIHVVTGKTLPELTVVGVGFGHMVLYLLVALMLACAVYSRRDLK